MGRESESGTALAEPPETREKGTEIKEELLCRFDGKVDSWHSNEQGVVIESEGQLFLNGETELLPPGTQYDDWYLTPDGVVLRQEKDFLIRKFDYSAVDPLYTDEGNYKGCYEFPGGVCIRDGNRHLINGTEEVMIQDSYRRAEYHPQGVITEGMGLVIHKPDSKRNRLYEGNTDPDKISWRGHPYTEGVVITKMHDNKLYLCTDARQEPQLICQDDFMSWEPCKNGVVGLKDDGLHFYGFDGAHEVLFEGFPDEYQTHPEGVSIKDGLEWRLMKIGG